MWHVSLRPKVWLNNKFNNHFCVGLCQVFDRMFMSRNIRDVKAINNFKYFEYLVSRCREKINPLVFFFNNVTPFLITEDEATTQALQSVQYLRIGYRCRVFIPTS